MTNQERNKQGEFTSQQDRDRAKERQGSQKSGQQNQQNRMNQDNNR